MVPWRVYYGDGTVYDGSPEDAPALNVQAVAVHDPVVGRFIWSARDFYWWESGQWFGGDIFGLWDYLARPGWRKVLFGRSLTRGEYEKAMKHAIEDPELPAKSAWDDREARL
jgi:hypothetical protein